MAVACAPRTGTPTVDICPEGHTYPIYEARGTTLWELLARCCIPQQALPSPARMRSLQRPRGTLLARGVLIVPCPAVSTTASRGALGHPAITGSGGRVWCGDGSSNRRSMTCSKLHHRVGRRGRRWLGGGGSCVLQLALTHVLCRQCFALSCE